MDTANDICFGLFYECLCKMELCCLYQALDHKPLVMFSLTFQQLLGAFWTSQECGCQFGKNNYHDPCLSSFIDPVWGLQGNLLVMRQKQQKSASSEHSSL